MNAHTPGPWKVWTDHETKKPYVGVFDGDEVLLVAADLTPEDAHLVAAAPELLEALNAIVEESEHFHGMGVSHLLIRARAAIKKATDGD